MTLGVPSFENTGLKIIYTEEKLYHRNTSYAIGHFVDLATSVDTRTGKNLRFLKEKFRFLGFLGF